MMTLSQKIRRLLRDRYINYFADRAGVNHTTITALAAGRRDPRIFVIRAVAGALNVRLCWLLDDARQWPPSGCAGRQKCKSPRVATRGRCGLSIPEKIQRLTAGRRVGRLAVSAGIPPHTFSCARRGAYTLRLAGMRLIAAALGVRLCWLIDDNQGMPALPAMPCKNPPMAIGGRSEAAPPEIITSPVVTDAINTTPVNVTPVITR
jgi:hypothetical protein